MTNVISLLLVGLTMGLTTRALLITSSALALRSSTRSGRVEWGKGRRIRLCPQIASGERSEGGKREHQQEKPLNTCSYVA